MCKIMLSHTTDFRGIEQLILHGAQYITEEDRDKKLLSL